MDLTARTYIKVNKSNAEVFEAVVDPAKMANDVKVERVTPASSVVWTWDATGKETRVEMTFEALADDVTKVSVVENGWDKTDAGIAALAEQTQGWTQFMCGLKAFVELGINLRTGAY